MMPDVFSYKVLYRKSYASAAFNFPMLPMNLTMDMATEMTDAAIFNMFSNNFSLLIYSSFPPVGYSRLNCLALLEEYISIDSSYTMQVSDRGIIFIDSGIDITPL